MQQIDFYFAFAYNYRNGRISTCKNSSCVTYFFHFVLFIYLRTVQSITSLVLITPVVLEALSMWRDQVFPQQSLQLEKKCQCSVLRADKME